MPRRLRGGARRQRAGGFVMHFTAAAVGAWARRPVTAAHGSGKSAVVCPSATARRRLAALGAPRRPAACSFSFGDRTQFNASSRLSNSRRALNGKPKTQEFFLTALLQWSRQLSQLATDRNCWGNCLSHNLFIRILANIVFKQHTQFLTHPPPYRI